MTYKTQLRMFIPMAVAVCLVAAAGVGCGSTTKVDGRTTTVGQELQDLEAARNKGLLTEEEYQRKREDIMERE